MNHLIKSANPVKKLLLEQYLRGGKLTSPQRQLKQELIKQAWAHHQSSPHIASQKHSTQGELK